MPLQYSQFEVESELSDIVKNGDLKKIATIVGVHPTYIDQQCNKDNERKSWIYQTLQFICAEDDIDCERGEALLQMICRFRSLSKIRRNGENLCVAAETGNLNREIADVVNAHLQGKSFYEQLKEIDEAEAQMARTKEAILCAVKKEKELLKAHYVEI